MSTNVTVNILFDNIMLFGIFFQFISMQVQLKGRVQQRVEVWEKKQRIILQMFCKTLIRFS